MRHYIIQKQYNNFDNLRITDTFLKYLDDPIFILKNECYAFFQDVKFINKHRRYFRVFIPVNFLYSSDILCLNTLGSIYVSVSSLSDNVQKLILFGDGYLCNDFHHILIGDEWIEELSLIFFLLI
jgi:hypothetical protein